ncbi:MAG TPA: ABC transporter permease [Gemmatimonadaceae bacterium]|jgi:predicted permease|nr:ABC transporter permease [Gemmatimonadaceae bacterium]
MTLRELVNRLRDRVFRERLSRELEEELRFHRAMLERDEGNACRLGNTTYYREETRAMWSLGNIDDWMQDVRYAFRALRATPAFALVVTLTLALGIGATTAIYTVVDTVLLRPLPYPEPDRLVAMSDVQEGGRETPAGFDEYLEWRKRSGAALSDVGVAFGSGDVLQTSDGAEQLMGTRMSANMPALLGVRIVLGRTFNESEVATTAPAVVMLSEVLWRSHFGGDPSIVGRTVSLSGTPNIVVGVFASGPNTLVPSAFHWSHRRLPDFVAPLRLDEKSSPPGMHWLNVIGKLGPGVTIGQARTRLASMTAAIRQDRHTTHGLAIEPLAESLFGSYRAPLTVLLAGVAVLLLIACVNTANLLLARTATRRREFAVRAALGAGRRRLLRLLLVESVLRAVVGGASGIALAYALVRVLRAWLAASVARMADATIDARVLGVAVAVTVASGLLFGLLPALRAGRGDAADDLRDGARGVTGGAIHERSRRALMVAEVALSFMLLATAGMLARSVVNLLRVPKGFDAEHLVAGFTWLPPSRYRDSVAQKQFFDRLTSELGGTYGSANITLASDLPITGSTDGGVGVEGREYTHDDMPNAEKRIVGPNYFQMLGARLVSGRSFEAGDDLGQPPVVVINESLASLLFPKQNAVGRRVSFGWGIAGYQTVAGVVADLHETALDQPTRPAIYISYRQRPSSSMRFLVRTTAPQTAVVTAFRDVLRRIDPTIPLVETRTMDDVVRGSMQQQRLTTTMLGAFAVAALLLAAIGLYGVIGYSVAQRTQELGVRAALGALPRDLMRFVLGQTATFTLAGIALGIAGAVASRRLIAAQLFGIGPTDVVTLALAGIVLAVVAVLASLVPMRRAARADPLEALRAR